MTGHRITDPRLFPMSSTAAVTDPLRLKLNRETARLPWQELLRHFASGMVVVVNDRLDLIEVAVAFSQDATLQVQSWMQAGDVARATDAQAAQWLAENVSLWTLVVRPWILVQREKPA